MKLDFTNFERLLSNICKPPARIAVMGIGNYLRADDFLGVTIIQKLKEKIKSDSVLLLEAEIAPTDFFHTIQEWNPTHLIIIDASELKAEPGTLKLIKREQMATFTLSSHKKALTLLMDLLSVYVPNLEIIIVGIQPETIDYKIGLSQPIQKTVDKLSEMLVSFLSDL